MPYPKYNGPDKPDKGKEGGTCNRRQCQDFPAPYYNHGSHAWYCVSCMHSIADDVVNARNWPRDFSRTAPGQQLHPMFETRRQMDARIASRPLFYGTRP